jgi:YrbI family 3-deoxy-D-manno-octulosonate 8-phosphate phosphatase
MMPKLVITDIDGVWTDGGMYYDNKGNELKKFNTYDSAGINFLKLLNVPVCIITGEDTYIVKARAKKVEVNYLFLGVKNKLLTASTLIDRLNIKFEEIAFLGDDINDIPLLQKAGISAVPISSPDYVKKHAHIVIPYKGGEGVFRAFVELILSENQLLEYCIQKTLERYNN